LALNPFVGHGTIGHWNWRADRSGGAEVHDRERERIHLEAANVLIAGIRHKAEQGGLRRRPIPYSYPD
jgi:hypothetical protein